MNLIFSRRNRPGAWLISLGTFSRWSHVALLHDGTVWDATGTHGVARRPIEAFAREYQYREIGHVPCDDAAALAWADAQVGKSYDYTAVLGIAFRTGWAHDDKWFCSEFVEAALMAGGAKRFREDLSRVTPRDSWMVTLENVQ